jgi:DNA replication and repair protein RecF
MVLLSLSKSYYSSPLSAFVHWDLKEEESGLPEYFRINGQVQSNQGKLTDLEVGCGRSKKYPKTIKVDGVKVKPHEYIGHLKTVLFTPQDLNMVFLSPMIRRRYVNVLLSQVDPQYLRHLSQYQLVLKHRNKLLEQLREATSRVSELDYWDEQLVLHGSYLLWKRKLLFESFQQKLSTHYEQISSESLEFSLVWKKNWHGSDLPEVQESFGEYIREKRKRDIDASLTCGGPHREDYIFQMKGKNLAEFGSRGECRSAVLSLKLAEAEYIREICGDSPVVLFDDVFSELDVDRQKNLLRLFPVEQVIITTTHLEFTREDAIVWSVQEGMISETT